MLLPPSMHSRLKAALLTATLKLLECLMLLAPYLWVALNQRAALSVDTLGACGAAARAAAGACVGATVAINQRLAVWAASCSLADAWRAGAGAFAGGLRVAALVLPVAAQNNLVVAAGSQLHLCAALPGGAEAQVLGNSPGDSGPAAYLHQ